MSIQTFPWTVDGSEVRVTTDRLGERKMVFRSLIGRPGLQFLVRRFAQRYPETPLIQDALAFLTADEREFLMTGMTGQEWDKLFFDKEN